MISIVFRSMSVDRSIECRHHIDEKEYIRGGCRRVVYVRCPAFERRVYLQHLSEPHIDILIDYANQIRARLETMSIHGTKQRL